MTVETNGRNDGNNGGNDGNDGGEMTDNGFKWQKRRGKPRKNDQSLNACNFLNNGPILNP